LARPFQARAKDAPSILSITSMRQGLRPSIQMLPGTTSSCTDGTSLDAKGFNSRTLMVFAAYRTN
jgi:hypothetical protein